MLLLLLLALLRLLGLLLLVFDATAEGRSELGEQDDDEDGEEEEEEEEDYLCAGAGGRGCAQVTLEHKLLPFGKLVDPQGSHLA